MSLVQDYSGLPAVGGQMVGDDVATDLEDIVHDGIDRLLDLLARDYIDVVEDANRLLELLRL